MSEANEIEREQEAPTTREAATGPLLPRWVRVLVYVLLIPPGALAVVFIARSAYLQSRTTISVEAVVGTLDQLPDLSGAEGAAAVEWLEERPLDGFLYLNQELLRDEVDDERMARALALRKATGWGRNSTRLEVIRQILEHMTNEGGLEAAFAETFQQDESTRTVLEEMVAERSADPEMTYAENRITDVLAWLAEGAPGRPTGPEKRRMQALEKQYAKRAFVGPEASALESLADEWQQDSDPLAREAAGGFAEMLEGRKAELSEEAMALCASSADEWEGRYHQGMTRAAEVGYRLLEQVLSADLFIDHPYIYQYILLLGHQYDEVRERIAAGTWLLRHNKFGIRFVSYYATKTAINPVMAVETLRLTKEEHERLMRRLNTRRLHEAVRLLGRLGVDYVEHTSEYELEVKDQDAFVRAFVIHGLQDVTDNEVVGEAAKEALAAIRQADLRRPGGPLFFEAVAER
jgi:hypothetical protein